MGSRSSEALGVRAHIQKGTLNYRPIRGLTRCCKTVIETFFNPHKALIQKTLQDYKHLKPQESSKRAEHSYKPLSPSKTPNPWGKVQACTMAGRASTSRMRWRFRVQSLGFTVLGFKVCGKAWLPNRLTPILCERLQCNV